MNKTIRVRLTKIGACETPEASTPTFDCYEPGTNNGEVSVPNNYCVEGFLCGEIAVGESVTMMREIRNGIKMSGLFQTSPVTKITESGFETLNSVYVLTKLS